MNVTVCRLYLNQPAQKQQQQITSKKKATPFSASYSSCFYFYWLEGGSSGPGVDLLTPSQEERSANGERQTVKQKKTFKEQDQRCGTCEDSSFSAGWPLSECFPDSGLGSDGSTPFPSQSRTWCLRTSRASTRLGRGTVRFPRRRFCCKLLFHQHPFGQLSPSHRHSIQLPPLVMVLSGM